MRIHSGRITDGPERALRGNMLDRNRAALIDVVRGLSEVDARRRLSAYDEVGNHATVRVLENTGFSIVDRRSYRDAICDYFELSVAGGACTV